jgi:predicted metalloprotease with PDZ domain
MSDSLAQGLPVRNVQPGSPADVAGVKVGDTILIANGLRIDSVLAYAKARGIRRDRLDLTVQRGQRILDFEIQLSGGTPLDTNQGDA